MGHDCPRRRALAVLAVAVLALHVLALWAVAPAWFDPDDDTLPAPAALSVRSVTLAPAPLPQAAPPAARPLTAARPAAPSRARPSRAASQVPPPEPIEPAPAAAAPAEAASVPPPVADTPLAVAATGVEASPPPPLLPTYATQPPAAGQWRYELQRGAASGEALLSWQPEADGRYRLQLEGRVAGVSVLDWVSQGAIDGAGLAPERFVIRRRGRDSQAANFQRDAAKVTFSGPTHELPLLPGVQDRLSWMLQMAAIVQAAPARFGPGATLTLMVVGARGGADVWRFEVAGVEQMQDKQVLKLVRQARRPRETQVEIWLDAARAYLPMRALLTQPEGGAPLELRYASEIREGSGSTGP